MSEKLDALKQESRASTRGVGLESFLAELFGREHYRVETNFVAARRQVDLFAIRGNLTILIEAKWTTRASGQSAIDGLQARLRNTTPGVVGLLVSMGGFSRAVADRILESPQFPILLMDGVEVERVVEQGGGLNSLVHSKLEQLIRNRRVVVGRPPAGSPIWLEELPQSPLAIVDADGHEHPYWESVGEFSQALSTATPRNADVLHGGVRLELVLRVDGAGGLVNLLKALAQLGWISSEGAWRIEQSHVVWSGLGAAELATQLLDWEPRYRERQMHHSEVVMYVDESDDGMLTIMADISATSERLVRRCELSFILPGIPLDVTPYHSLAFELPVVNTPVFEMVGDVAVETYRFGTPGMPTKVEPTAHLVYRSYAFDQDITGPRSWVAGLIIKDPMAGSSADSRVETGFPVADLGHVFVHLPEHYPHGEAASHSLGWGTTARVGPLQLLNLTGRWDAPDPVGER